MRLDKRDYLRRLRMISTRGLGEDAYISDYGVTDGLRGGELLFLRNNVYGQKRDIGLKEFMS